MAFDSRGYYYRGKRNGDRVERQYFGRGESAEAAAREDDLHRAELAELRAMAQTWQEFVARLDLLIERMDALAEASLLAGGYHRQNRSRWRPWTSARNDPAHDPG